MIKYVFLDIDDTLLDFGKAEAAAIKKTFDRIGVPSSPEVIALYSRINDEHWAMLERGELPLRVTHNDTKLNNVLLDAKTRKALCVVDLDTVMPGSSLFDFGDAIRYGASTAAEDERDLSKVEMSLERFRVFTRGYVRACPNLTARELELLPLGAKTITLECGMRFLTDHIDGDLYFAVHREGQNLDRARAQFKLAADMEKKWDDMRRIVAEETKA